MPFYFLWLLGGVRYCRADATTSDCVYASVCMADADNLPRISRDQKAKVLDLTTGAPASWTSSAVPLFWCESDPAAFHRAKFSKLLA